MKRKAVILKMNMLDEEEREIFSAEVPYEVRHGSIESEDNLKIPLNQIWVDFDVRFID